MDREFYELRSKLMLWDNEEGGEEYNWREVAMNMCDKRFDKYEIFINLPYRKAIEILMIKNKIIQRANKQYE